MNARTFKQMATVLLTLAAILLFTLPAFADGVVPTTEQIKAAVTQGQAYLKSIQNPAVYNNGVYVSGGDWPDDYYGSYPVGTTGFAVAALLDTGVPKTDQHIIDGINYLRANAKANCSDPSNPAKWGNGGVSQSGDNGYTTGIALIAFSSFNDPADRTIVENMVHLYELSQSANGGWRYYLSGSPGDYDMSVTQFGVMGLWYGYRYLGKTFDTDATTRAVKDKVFNYLKYSYTNGQFGYAGPSTGYRAMTAAGLWSLGMIGMNTNNDSDTYGTPTGKTMADGAISWFNTSYSWANTYGNVGYYFIFGMAKALTITLGEKNNVGTHPWVDDLKTAIYNDPNKTDTPASGNTPAMTSWYNTYYPYGRTNGTSLVLLSLSFADVNQPVPDRILAQDTGLDNDTKGAVVIHTTGGVLIEPVRSNPADPNSAALPFRTNTTGEGLSKEVTTYLPLGAFRFKLKPVPVGGTADFTIDLPANALCYTGKAGCTEGDIKKSFLDRNGNLKKGLDWFKLDNGKWKGNKKIPMVLDKGAGTITVTLTDGGLGDDDRTVNGEITDPAAPGYDPFVDLTLADALKTLKIAVGIDPVTADALLSYDIAPVVNGEVLPDNKIDLFDAMMILRKSVGLPVTPTGGV